jgi:hypothetical protein
MNRMKLTHLLVLAAILTVASTGCRKRPGYVTPIPAGRMGTPTTAGPAGPLTGGEGINGTTTPGAGDVSSTGAALADPGSFAGWPEDAEKFKPYTVYFAFDSS